MRRATTHFRAHDMHTARRTERLAVGGEALPHGRGAVQHLPEQHGGERPAQRVVGLPQARQQVHRQLHKHVENNAQNTRQSRGRRRWRCADGCCRHHPMTLCGEGVAVSTAPCW